MKKDRLKREILQAVTEVGAAERPAQEWLVPLGAREPNKRNHFVLFMKPELLAVREGAKLGPILDLIGTVLRRHGIKSGAIRVLNGPYLARHNIMEEHYGVINRTSRLGRSALSPPTRQKLEAECPGINSILGGHQFLEHYPDVSAFALNIVADTLGSKKLASGKYYSVLNVEGERVLVLNAFHPQQLLHYTRPGQTLAVFECWSDTDWQALRHNVTGATDPTRAVEGSNSPHVAGEEPRARSCRGHDGDQRRALLCRALGGHAGIQPLLLRPWRQDANPHERDAVRSNAARARIETEGYCCTCQEPTAR